MAAFRVIALLDMDCFFAAVEQRDNPALREQAEEIAVGLQKNQLAAKTVEVRVRYGDFTTLNRQLTFEDPTADAKIIYRFACHLLARHRLVSRPLRLLGLGVSHLVPPGQQLLLPLS